MNKTPLRHWFGALKASVQRNTMDSKLKSTQLIFCNFVTNYTPQIWIQTRFERNFQELDETIFVILYIFISYVSKQYELEIIIIIIVTLCIVNTQYVYTQKYARALKYKLH